MRKAFLISIVVHLVIFPILLNGQEGNMKSGLNDRIYKIDNAFYLQGDSSTVLKNWTDQGMHIAFRPAKDSLVISIDIGGRDKVFFMGMAVTMDNPGFLTSSTDVEFYHWIFASRIKEGIRNAYIQKEYVEGSLERLGRKTYFFNVAFADQTEFQFYGFEISPDGSGKK